MTQSQKFTQTNELVSVIKRIEFVAPVIALGALFILMSCATTNRTDGKYKSVDEILPSDSYRAEVSGTSNELRISGNGKTAVFSSGVSGFAVNGNWYDLERTPVYREGKLHLYKSDATKLKKALTTTTARANTNKSTTTRDDTFTVVVDPGHGGKFVGARGINGKLEKRLNLAVARYTYRHLNQDHIDVKLTRSTDSSLSSQHKQDLDERVQLADRVGADLFISIHANAARSSSAKGFELFVSPKDDRPDTIQRLKSWHPDPSDTTHSVSYNSYYQMYRDHRRKSLRLARHIRNQFKQVVPTGSRGIKQKSLHVLRNAPCPAVLVELGFMTNQRESNLLSRNSYQRKLGKQIAQAVNNFQRSLAHRKTN